MMVGNMEENDRNGRDHQHHFPPSYSCFMELKVVLLVEVGFVGFF